MLVVARETEPKGWCLSMRWALTLRSHLLRAWSRRGERARCAVPRNRGKNTTLLSSMSMEGMGPSLTITAAVNTRVFEAYLERILLPELHPGRIVVMDNLSAHKTEKVTGSWSREPDASCSICHPTRPI